MYLPIPHIIGTVAATAAVIRTVSYWDCNPSLYWTDVWFRYCEDTILLRRRQPSTVTTQYHRHHHPFQNQCIWIIGASSGIGKELAYQLVQSPLSQHHHRPNSPQSPPPKQLQQPSQNHHHPIHLILSSRSVESLQTVATQCYQYNPNCTITILPMDVTNDTDMYRAIEQLHTIMRMNTTTTTTAATPTTVEGLIDTVVFNAGIGHLSPALETSVATIDRIWKCTARYPMILIPLLLPLPLSSSTNGTSCNNRVLMKHIDRPHFVMTSSIAAMIPVPLSSAYGAAKAALWNYGRTLQAEYPQILLHTIMPGPVDTNFHQHKSSSSTSSSTSTSNSNSNNTDLKSHTLLPQEQPQQNQNRSPLKMSVQRCVQLMISTMQLSYSTESWLVPSSSSSSPLLSLVVLLGLYLHKLLPIAWLQSMIYSKLGPKRIQMWRQGYDLYDLKSWHKE